MMNRNVLITGGAGFIGSHLADELLAHGYHVRVLDNLSPQVHYHNGAKGGCPAYLNKEVEFIYGDVRSPDAVRQALRGMDAVYHFAAAVGVGQSMYEIEKYTSTNNLGTAVLLQALLEHPVEKLIVASSMSVYGEGLYRASDDRLHAPRERSPDQLKAGVWELHDEHGHPLNPVATSESKTPFPTSIYALSKYDQERMCLMVGRACNIPTVGLRFFNVFGTRQALSNPYTGVLAIFASRYLNNKPPLIFEDGYQKRDFVSVYDVARACRLALELPEAEDLVLNIGSGCAYTIREVAERMARVLGKEHLEPEITGKYRVGDIRHCFADIELSWSVLNYEPRVAFEDGLAELADWLGGQIAHDYVDKASAELAGRGLTVETHR